MRVLFFALLFLFAANAWAHGEIQFTSDSFKSGAMIPKQYTCDGLNISPSLRWKGAPEKTRSLAIIMDDPDAPAGTWVHWVVYNLPPTVDMIPPAMPRMEKLANAERHGINDFKNLGYGGPCPPSGATHRYFFKIYALDTMLPLSGRVTQKDLLKAMKGHILAQGELMARYQRN